MPETEKEPQSCHMCGLESFTDCEDEDRQIHIPDAENLPPCKFCVRNKYSPRYAKKAERLDFFSETWTRYEDRSPIIEDPDPHEQNLLKCLHALIGGEKRWRKMEIAQLSTRR
jgi:hypothetical protein